MISVRGDVKLIDFGVARATHRLERTETDHVKGKFAYMAPEQIRGEGELDHRVDLFSVGLTLHELIAGYGPFHGLTQVQIMHRLLQGQIAELRLPRGYPEPARLIEIHRRALARDRSDRFESARAFAEALRSAATVVGGLASREEMVAFVSRVEPTIQKEVRDKLHNYSGPVDLGPVKEQLAAADLEASLSGVTATREVDTTVHSVLLAGGFATVVALLFTVGTLVLAVVFILSTRPAGLPEPSPTDEVQATQAAEPVDDSPPTPGAADQPHTESSAESRPTTLVPRSSTSAALASAPSVEQPTPPTLVAAKETPAESPLSADSPKEPADSEAAPATPGTTGEPATPEPTTQAVETPQKQGLIQVNSSPQGLAILIDGRDSGEVTPKKLPVGVGSHLVEVEGHPARTVEVREGQSVNVIFKEQSP